MDDRLAVGSEDRPRVGGLVGGQAPEVRPVHVLHPDVDRSRGPRHEGDARAVGRQRRVHHVVARDGRDLRRRRAAVVGREP